MSLINCPECGKEISDQATSCPNCGTPIKKGETKFCQHCGETIDKDCVICPKCGKQVKELKNSKDDKNIIINNNNTASSSASASASAATGGFGNFISPKSRLVTLLLCIFLGWLGIHRFYVGKVVSGIIMVLLMFTGIGEVWLFIDFIVILLGSFKDSMGLLVKNW